MSNFIASKYQVPVFDLVQTGVGNAIVNAVAGSGKTTTIVRALEFIPADLKIIFLAFNKSIVEELRTRVPKHVEVSTLHSFGWSCLRKLGRVELDNYKVSNIAKNMVKAWVDKDDEYEYKSKIVKLVDLIRLNVLSDPEELYEAGIRQDMEIYREDCHRAFEVFKITKMNMRQFDFTDMIYIPATNDKITVPTYDWVLIDEVQDLNKAQMQLFLKMVKPETGRFIGVGDKKQSIYGFAGADINSFNNLLSLPNTVELPLSVSYRCGSSIIDFAKPIVPYLEAREDAHVGQVNETASIKEIKDGDVVICRNTMPLVQLCLEFLGKGVKAFVKGSDIGANIINLIKKSKKIKYEDLERWLNKEVKKLLLELGDQHPDLSVTELEEFGCVRLLKEKANVIDCIYENNKDVETCDQLIGKIKEIFSDNSTGICFSTIHKSKGLEYDNVFIIERDLMPSKYAKQEWQKEQERNLEYVAYTRAKHYLGFITDWQYKRKERI